MDNIYCLLFEKGNFNGADDMHAENFVKKEKVKNKALNKH